jgi:hypothetical protein
MSARVTLASGAAVAMLAGCGTVVTSVPSRNDSQGLVYALPKGQVQVLAQRKRVEADEVAAAKKRLSDAKAAAAVSQAKLKELTAAQAQARKEAKAAAEAAATAGAADAVLAVKVVKEREAALADLLQRLSKTEDDDRQAAVVKFQRELDTLDGQVGKWVETITVSVLPHVPDRAHRYLLRHDESLARDDKLKFEVSNGLLSSSTAESTGQMSTVLLNVARALGASSVPGTKILLSPAPELAGPKATPPSCVPYDLDLRFDPTDAQDVAGAEQALGERGLALKLSGFAPGTPATNPAEPIAGLVYRAPVPMQIAVSAAKETDAKKADARQACGLEAGVATARVSGIFPDATSRFALPIQGAAFAKVSAKYGFKDGMPVSADIDRPSQFVAVTALPVDILKALISVPAELIKLRVDYSSQAAAQTEAQVREAKAQQDLIKALEDLEAARKSAASWP